MDSKIYFSFILSLSLNNMKEIWLGDKSSIFMYIVSFIKFNISKASGDLSSDVHSSIIITALRKDISET